MRYLAAVCLFLACSSALMARANSGQLGELLLRGTQLSHGALRITLRGVLPFPSEFAAHPRAATEGWQAMLEHEIKLWNLLIYAKPSLESAFLHQQSLSMPLMQGLYLINPQVDENADSTLSDPDGMLQHFEELRHSPQTIFALYEGGEWHDGEPTTEMRADRWRYLTLAELQQYFPDAHNREKFAVAAYPRSYISADTPIYSVPAFTKRKVIGVNHASTLHDRSLRSVFNKTRTLLKEGYRIVFNEDVGHAISALQHQERKGQTVKMNRYRNSKIEGDFRAAYAAGKAFDVLLRNPDGEIEAGVVGYVHNNIYSPDSVFGDDLDKVKVVDFALMRYLHTHGIDFVNAGMVTPYTESIKGYRVAEQDYQKLVETLPPEPVSLPHSWQDMLAIVNATKKTNRRHLERLVAAGKAPSPLLLVNSSSNEQPATQSTKNNARTASLERLLASVESFVIITQTGAAEGRGPLPDSLRRYLTDIRSVDVVPVQKVNIMHVSTFGGFPLPLPVTSASER